MKSEQEDPQEGEQPSKGGDDEPAVEDLEDDPAYSPDDEGLKQIKGG